jgi:superfamily II DNA or RNA helicase
MFLLLGLDREESELSSTRPPSLSGQSAVRIPRTNAPDLVRRLCQTGRCHLGDKTMTLGPALLWVGEEPWRLELELEESATQNGERRPEAHPESAPYLLRGVLVRGTEKQTVQEADFLGCGVVVWGNAAGAYSAEHGSWLEPLSRTGSITVLPEEFGTFIRRYYQASSPAPLRLPPSLALTERACEPQFLLDVLAPDSVTQGLPCQASARYGAQKVSLDARGTKVVDLEDRAVYPRVLEAEQQAKTLLTRLGFRGGLLEVPAGYPCWGPDELRLAKSRLPAAVEALVSAGWRVLAQGKTYRRAGSLAIAVTTGLDWLDLRGGARFEGVHLALPELLSALARRERTVLLDDGTLGLLPEEWLERWGMVADLADPEGMSRGTDHGGGRVRLRRAHVGLLDALLETVEEATWDDAFATLRDELRGFRGLEPAPAPKSFVGTLRPYQAEGLAWLEFVARLGFGGCLADDMGLGKTIQVLALLLKRRAMRHGRSSKTPRSQPSPKTSLIVVPRSLVHNWIEEARRFAPSLRFLSHVGSARDQDLRTLQGYDVLVTSYGTLLRDLEQLRQIEFDCVVLDEAQAIKTAGTQTAKAVRLLRGNVRLALTGTPVENHLGELWSLFDFLNPGLFGAIASWKRSTTRITEGRTAEGESRELLRRTIRPFIVRRTKAAVAKDLPPRSEETLWVELDQEERRRYDDLLAYYQAVVEKRVVAAGVERATPLLLEALLRLRQAACHPGLLDPDQRQNPSAKLEVLLEHLQRLREEGHKALVFSQFTSLLAIVRERLEGLSVQYEYLDGKTRDRPSRVAHFQNDPTVSHFLISLKAGGLGLNLTAADYVFILDPWWNPAVEAQAIDRSHRIGQSRHVFAYRLIARNTVEERVAELQQRKRRLVEAILGEQSGLAGKLTRKDLEFLLG